MESVVSSSQSAATVIIGNEGHPMVDKERESEEFRYIVERVEEKDLISSNDEDVADLKNILQRKITDLQTDIESSIDKNE